MVGTCNLWGYVEFLYYLKELGYDGWITSDTSPVTAGRGRDVRLQRAA